MCQDMHLNTIELSACADLEGGGYFLDPRMINDVALSLMPLKSSQKISNIDMYASAKLKKNLVNVLVYWFDFYI